MLFWLLFLFKRSSCDRKGYKQLCMHETTITSPFCHYLQGFHPLFLFVDDPLLVVKEQREQSFFRLFLLELKKSLAQSNAKFFLFFFYYLHL